MYILNYELFDGLKVKLVEVFWLFNACIVILQY